MGGKSLQQLGTSSRAVGKLGYPLKTGQFHAVLISAECHALPDAAGKYRVTLSLALNR